MIIDSAIYSRTFALCIFRKVILIDIFRQKPPESFQKVYVFSFILRNVPNIWATFKEFLQNKDFPKYVFQEFAKKT